MKVSFDFDDTLSFKHVQQYAKSLINRGIEVHIITSRYSNTDNYELLYSAESENNKDLFKVADKLGIKKENIHFTEMEYKVHFFAENTDFVFHLDDNEEEIRLMKSNPHVKTKPWDVLVSDWKERCEDTILMNQ